MIKGDKILLLTTWTKIMTLYSLIQNTFVLWKPGVANFADVMKTSISLFKTTFAD